MTPEPRAHRSPFFFGWWIVAAGFVSIALNGALLFHAFGAYVVLLQADFGWSRTTLSLAFALQRVETGFLGPLEGWLVDRFGPRIIMMIGTTIFGLGFMMLSQINSLTTFYVAFLVMALGAALGSFLPASVAVVNWFSRRRATALAVMMLGLAVGGLVQPVVVGALDAFGWRATAFGSGVLAIAVGVPLALLVRHRPYEYGWTPDGDPREASAAPPPGAAGHDAQHDGGAFDDEVEGEISFTPRQALATRAFWMIGLGHGLSLLVVGAVMVHFVAHVNESLGYSLATAAKVITVMTVVQVIGQMGGGFLGDRISKRYLIIVAMLMNAAGLFVLAIASSLWMVMVFAVLNGLGFGARIPLTTAIRADYFGDRYYGTISGMNSMVVTGGIIAGPLIAGASYDLTGSYVTGFTGLAIAAAAGSVFFLFAKKPAPPAGAGVGQPAPIAAPSPTGPAPTSEPASLADASALSTPSSSDAGGEEAPALPSAAEPPPAAAGAPRRPAPRDDTSRRTGPE